MTDLQKYIEDEFLCLGFTRPYSEHILAAAMLLVVADYFKISYQRGDGFDKKKLSSDIIACLNENHNQLINAIVILADNAPDNALENLIQTKVFSSDYLTSEDCADFLNAFIVFYQEANVHSYTPDSINRLCACLLSPVDGTFYDGVAGIGSSLMAVYDYSKSNGGDLAIHCQEINSLNYAILMLRAFFAGIPSEHILNADTLAAPMNLDEKNKKLIKFDYSVMFPPFGQRWNQSKRLIKANKYAELSQTGAASGVDLIYAQHMYLSLNENSGKGIIGVPSGALFNEAFRNIREELLRTGHIESIISLPSGVLSFTATPLCLIVINKALKNDANILMINMSDRLSSTRKTRGQSPLTDQMTDEILKLYCERKNSKYSCLAALDNMPDSILLPERYVSGKQIATSDFGGVRINEAGLSDAYRTTLKDAGKFFRGVNVSNYFEEDARGTFSIINYQDIQNGLLNIDSVKQYRLKESKTDANKLLKYRVAAGDILISCKGHAIKTCLVPELPGEYLLSLNFAAIRINHEEFHSGFIKYYLDSPVGQYLIESRQMGSSIITLNIKDLEQIPIPLPPLERQMEYHDFLYSGSERIYKSMQLLEKQLADLKWAFYEKLGLETIMEKEQEHEKQSAER